MYRFKWNQRKNEHNIRKHGVSFEEAVTVFYDEEAIMLDDPDHSKDEERFLLIGMSDAPRLLIVCHCYRKKDSIIRIISARKTTKSEENDFIELKKGT